MDMQHPAFGPIEYYDDKWEGRVRVPFFAAYDYADSWPDWNREQLKEGLFDLFIQDKAGVGPTSAQERAFVREWDDHGLGVLFHRENESPDLGSTGRSIAGRTSPLGASLGALKMGLDFVVATWLLNRNWSPFEGARPFKICVTKAYSFRSSFVLPIEQIRRSNGMNSVLVRLCGY